MIKTPVLPGWKAAEDEFVLPTYAKFPIALERARGCFVFDTEGNRYLDFYGGHAVALLGHNPAGVVKALCDQARRLMFYSNLAHCPVRAEAAKALVGLLGVPGGKVFFCNSGAEANENAMTLARIATGRPTVVSTEGSFHGRTAGALAATGLKSARKRKSGLASDSRIVPFGDAAAADEAIGADTAAVLVEPIQSMAGVVVPPEGYLAKLEALCRERGAVLIFDEVQTGLGRVGAPSAAHAFGVRPHIQTFAKALGSGFPCGAVVAGAETAAAVKTGDLGSTFGGGPMAAAAILATVSEIRLRRLWEDARHLGSVIRSMLRFPGLRAVRGRGILLGLELDRPARPVRDALFAQKILTGLSDDPSVLRLLPPLAIGTEEVIRLKNALKRILT